MFAVVVAAALLVMPWAPAALGKGPSDKVKGKYVFVIAGDYTGGGDAHANPSGVKIEAKVRDRGGNWHVLDADKLEVEKDRFRGTGKIGSETVEIDGRVDPEDKHRGQVLKKGRITFTFRTASGKFARGAGDQREKGNSGGGGNNGNNSDNGNSGGNSKK